MQSSTQEILPIIGTAMAGGFYAGRITQDGKTFALIVAPKSEGEAVDIEWINDDLAVPGALSFVDGVSNTAAMAEAGSKLAIWARDLRIGGHDDWYIPAQDELEVIYRNLKPTTESNYQWARSGINLSAVPPTHPYSANTPAQTLTEAFQIGSAEAFDRTWYWSSTQHAARSDYAWLQNFLNGDQLNDYTSFEGRARAVRRLEI